jgi:hypothetical protein
LPQRDVERGDEAEPEAQSTIRCQTAIEPDHVRPRARRLQQQERLRDAERGATANVIGEHAGERSERDDAEAAAKRRRRRAATPSREPIGEPTHRHLLQPGADDGESLADEEEPEIAMPQRAKRLADSHGRRAAATPSLSSIRKPRELRS